MSPETEASSKVSQMLTPGSVVLVGKVHGSTEFPSLVADVARQCTGAGVALHVGLEIPDGEQAALDRFLDASGGRAERDALLEGAFWRRPLRQQDGRSSDAMVDLLETLRWLRRRGATVAVTAIDGTVVTALAPPVDRDRAMAHALTQSIARHAGWPTLVLAGNGHTRTAPEPAPFGYVPMGWYLTQHHDNVISLLGTVRGGSVWTIMDPEGGGGVHAVGQLGLGVGHDGAVPMGFLTPSPPAAQVAPSS